ncbi:MSHA biogenesis protein MshQ [Vibrio kanaloae]|uniref:DUF6701 domain-containing protein n=1 Tax=Vibrio kanaloae TaxID=170673 RepID=UPI0010BF6539|nr:DUF6701 domain-containing protein [Vibrio kanaloae]TKE96355.1 MSHA biogenesis protein MshQ [Vibrio kanaloae]TKF15966.1 MSHA biogenesis protein MshQ [Vibrio kanaloae]
MKFLVGLFRTLKNYVHYDVNFLKLSVIMIVLCGASFVSIADEFSPQQCDDLKRQDGFSVAFIVPNPKTVTVVLESNKPDVVLWSSVASSAAKITDESVNPEERVLLVYKPISNNGKYGRLIYKLDTGAGYIEKQSSLILIDGGNGTLQVSGDTVVVECADGEEEPDPIPELEDVSYEFGSIEGMDCTHGCNLLFQKQYKNPIVFLMSTINSDDIVNSVPTKASVATIWDSKKGATIESESAESYNSTDRMSPIYYFVTEPGRLTFYDDNGSKVYGEAGNIITSKAQCKGNACGSSDWETVSFQGGDIANPVIMAQVQGKDRDWATTAISGLTNQKFKLALERGRQGPTSSAKQIAYLAVPTFSGQDESKTSKIEFFQAPGTYNQKTEIEPGKSIGWSCLNNEISLHQNFNKFGVIANKQTRNGGDGGWLRYCKQYVSGGESQFTFAFDEDATSLSTRKHGAYESVGYFAFEIPEVEIPVNVCNLFPEPIQSWTGVESSLIINNGAVTTFNGWSPDYLDAFSIENDRSWSPSNPNPESLLLVGFDLEGGTNQMYNHDVCGDDLGCAVGNEDSQLNRRKIDHNLLPNVPSRSVTETLPIDKNIKSRCDASNLCSFELVGANANVYINEDLKRLYINDLGNEYPEIRVHLKDGLYIDDFEISNGSGLVLIIPEQSSVTFNDFFASDTNRSDFIFGNNSKINVVTSFKFSNSVDIVNENAYPIIYAPDATVQLKGNFRGFILAKTLNLPNLLTVEGAVTAASVVSQSGLVINKPDYSCPLPPLSTGSLVVTPKYSHVLTCEVAEVEFKVVDDDGNVISTVQDNFTASHSPNSTGKWCEDENGNRCSTSSGDYQSHFVNGQKTLYLSSYKLESYDVSGTWNDDLETAASQINFVPYKFDVDEQFVVAGDGYEVTAKVSSCNTQDSSLSQDYVGTPKVSLDIVQPANGNDAISLFDYTPDFELSDKGETTDTLSIHESGQFKVTLTDNSFDCSEISGCPESGIDKLSGSFFVNSRPWKFAICTNSNSDGNSSGGSAFVAAGEEFDVFAKPIRFTSDANGLCSNSLVTQNYLLSSGAVVATHTLDTPSMSGAVVGSLEPTNQLTQSSSDIVSSDNGYKFKSLKYSEVGSINFEVTENSNSFYGKILGGFAGNKNIGRFYPEHLTLISNSWNYSSDHDSFAYMAQGISFNFIVEARNRDNEPVTNYGLFTGSLTASIKHVAINEEDGAVLNTRVWLSGGNDADSVSWGEDDWSSARLTIENFDYKFLRLASEDGPYDHTNSQFGLWVSDKVDGVDLQFLDLENTNGGYTNGTKFSFQPDFRYGRMSLKDVGGNQGRNIQVPLEVQYWSGSKFEINSDDSGSQFNGSDYCVTKIWDEPDATDAKLTSDTDDNESDDTVSVLNGISSDLIAKQDTSRREQVRLFLRQGSSPSGATCFGSEGTQPWLQYNWRQLGDEDPSTVITFGIYRGNDRVIYRGESGLTGQ